LQRTIRQKTKGRKVVRSKKIKGNPGLTKQNYEYSRKNSESSENFINGIL
jgi:hypothetical protein